MSVKNKWLLGTGIVLGLIVLFALPFIWRVFMPAYGFGMMSGHSPMMYGGGFSHMGGGMGFGMALLWLIPPALLVLVGLGIAALIKYLRAPSA